MFVHNVNALVLIWKQISCAQQFQKIAAWMSHNDDVDSCY